MNLYMNESLGDAYKSNSQKARIITEAWAKENTFCPSCGELLRKYNNNKPVADFYCASCVEDFELKSTSSKLGKSISDGAYFTMMERLRSNNNPNLYLLQYDKQFWSAVNYLIIPKYFFTPNVIVKRPPLPPTARRSGWVGCNINIHSIPTHGKIFLIKEGRLSKTEEVMTAWKKTNFLSSENSIDSRGWLISMISCIENLAKSEFTLDDIYKYEQHLKTIFPNNNHIKEKIRQQLQILRDKGYLEFVKKGYYRLI